ncbi:MlaD family protein [Mycolicibacterium litorale]|uniref:MlaD family protein n=1 Tax=Mycolicibacterium litorale TaxID=758802 RepID=UPI0039A3D3DF
MSPTRYPVEAPARIIVDTVRAGVRHRIPVAQVGMALVMVVALAYVVIVSLRVNPTQSTIAVRVPLPESGGLLPAQDVTLRGVPIGRVESVNLTDRGVTAVAIFNENVRIPQHTTARVSALTPAGEQYLDFRPQTDQGPYLTDGSTLSDDQTSVPVSFSQLISNFEGALKQVDPQKIAAIESELRVSKDGPHKLAALVDGGTFLITTLDSVLPETVSVLRTSRTVFTTLGDVHSGLQATTQNLQNILQGVNAMDSGYRALVDEGSAPLTQLDNIIADNSDTMVQLLGNLTTIAQLSVVRVPALQALFPTNRRSVVEALNTAVHDGGIWIIGDPYPRYSCDYNLPRHPPSQADFPEPYLYTYCANPDPSVLIRGARNAPRPPGDDTAGPPPGYNPLATTDPTPVGPHSVPTPYGGPPMPYEPPN